MQTCELLDEQAVKEILCEILEIEPGELTEEASFIDVYGADSLRAVEILASLEKELRVHIPESELPRMQNFHRVKEVLRDYGWQG